MFLLIVKLLPVLNLRQIKKMKSMVESGLYLDLARITALKINQKIIT